MERGRVRWKGGRRGESVYPWQLVDPIKADWLVNEAREARVLVPTGLFSAHSLTPLLQRKTIKKRMSKRCTFYVLIIPTLCLSICYSLSSAVKKREKKEKRTREKERREVKISRYTACLESYSVKRFGQVKLLM